MKEVSRLTIIKNINLWKYQYENIAYKEKIFSDFIHYLETFNADKNRLKVYNYLFSKLMKVITSTEIVVSDD